MIQLNIMKIPHKGLICVTRKLGSGDHIILDIGEVTLFMKPTQQPQALQVVVLLLLLKVCFFLHNLPE